MKITVAVNDTDYIKFNEYYMLNSSQGKKSIAIYRPVMPIFSIVAVIIMARLGVSKELLIVEIAALTVLSVIWMIRAPKMFLKEMGKNIDKIKKDGRLPYTEHAVLEFSDDAIIETTENSMKKVRYSEVSRIGYTDEHIFVFFGAVEAFVIPRRCIADVQTELETLLKEKVHA